MRRGGLIRLPNPPAVISSYCVVGKKENEGPLARFFDEHDDDSYFGEKTWELAESAMGHRALFGAIGRTGISPEDIGLVIGGDLQNQCVATSRAAADTGAPFLGIYGACSTLGEGLLLAATEISSGVVDSSAVVTSSHFCTAERQFRFPLPYGNQRQLVAQRTVTGAGAFVLSRDGAGPRIVEVMPGRIVDKGVSDANNMGAAMAPAAADTLYRYFKESGLSPDSFDLIATGDLASEGSAILRDLLSEYGVKLSDNYTDCGLMVYSSPEQDVHAGASGCGCSAVTAAGFIMKKMARGEINDALLIPTGALMSAGSVAQGGTIPGIAHLVRFRNM